MGVTAAVGELSAKPSLQWKSLFLAMFGLPVAIRQ